MRTCSHHNPCLTFPHRAEEYAGAMPTVARNIEDEQRRAWDDYADRLRGLEGAEYDRAEAEAWEELQTVLRELEGAAAPGIDSVG